MAVYTAEQLKCLQEIEIDILKEIERVCDVLDIQYFANYGTLLGAVRHKGFIPWDDDIDICMLRKDYDRFILEAPKVLKKGYTLQHFLVDPNTPTYHAKVRKDGTRFAEDYIENMPIHQGIFVDVFPYDKTADDEECRKKHMKKARLARHLFISKSVSQATNEKNEKKRRLANIIRKGIHSLLIPVPKKCLYNLVDKTMKKYNKEETKYVHCCTEDVQNYEDIFPIIKLQFGNTTICAPHNWNSFLRNEFGNYMQLPPENERYTHCPKVLDLGQ